MRLVRPWPDTLLPCLSAQGRGGTTGYDNAGALVGLEADGSEGQEDLFKETNKVYQVTEGSIEFAVNKVDGATGEFSGVFVSEQLSDTDMGSKAPKKASPALLTHYPYAFWSFVPSQFYALCSLHFFLFLVGIVL